MATRLCKTLETRSLFLFGAPSESMLLLEIKSTDHADSHQGRHVRAVSKEIVGSEAWVVSQDEKNRKEENLLLLHWKEAMKRIFPELEGDAL